MARSDIRNRLVVVTGVMLAFGSLLALACGEDSTGGIRQRPRLTDDDGGNGAKDGAIVVPEGSIFDPDTGRVMPIEEYLFRQLLPDLQQKCGNACHAQGTSPGNPPTWLKPPDEYGAVKAYPGAITRDPYLSVLINKGQHAGPAVDITDPDPKSFGKRFVEWLNAEAVALKAKPLPSTDPFDVVVGANTVDISKGGTGVTGAKITFTASVAGTVLSLTEIKLVAPAGTGIHIVQPLFIMVPPPPAREEFDPADNFSNVDSTFAAGSTAQLGAGSAIFTGWKWAAGNKLKIAFPKLEPGTAQDGGLAGGCKSVATFQSSAAPVLRGQGGMMTVCTQCHGNVNNMGATGALNLISLTGANPDFTTGCNQALSKVNLANKPASPLLVRPNTAAHAGGIANPYATFAAGINGWLANE
jgi:hypothetical protein